jgi:tetratricopeptide (TPR) repeat protein
LLLGRLHFARGEYRQAADAFARAGARLDPSRKEDARYWAGLSWLAMKEPNQARAALEEVEQSASSRRPEAMLGIALAWELAGRPDRAFDELERLLQRDPGEAGPAALERMSALTARLRRPDAAERARARLLREYPRSIEAAQAAAPEAEGSTPAAAGTLAVQIGVFSRPARAQTLAGAARRAGFSAAQVLTLGEGRARSYAVRLGLYPNAVEARKAGEEAARKLGVSYRVVSAP